MWSFHVAVSHKTAKKCTKQVLNAQLFYSLNFLFGDFVICVAVVIAKLKSIGR